MADKNLKNTILLENEEYNINAVRSVTAETADKVQATLTLKASNRDGLNTTNTTFNGETTQEITYVAASGGKFTNPIYVNNDSLAGKELPNDVILNFGQVTTQIRNLTGIPCWTWNGIQLTAPKEEDSYQNLMIITESSESLPSLKNYIEANADNSLYTNVFKDGAGLNFELYNSDTEYAVKKYIGKGGSYPLNSRVIIPAEYNGKPVTKIADYAFDLSNGNSGVTRNYIESIIIPNSVTLIGRSAFRNCYELKHITIPSSVVGEDSAAFDAVPGIGINAFGNCTALTSVTIQEDSEGKGLINIANSLFRNCRSLKSIVLPRSIKYISETAFEGCTSLEAIYYTGSSDTWGKNISSTTTLYDGVNEEKNAITDSSISNTAETGKITISYSYSNSSKNSSIEVILQCNFDQVTYDSLKNKPFIYICKDIDSEESPASNKMFLNVPGNGIIEISKSADRLNSTKLHSKDYYTYEGLVEIIAKINKRLEALGSTDLKVTTTAIAPTIPELEELKELYPSVDDEFNTNIIPTINQLQEQLTNITGKGYDPYTGTVDSIETNADEITPALRAYADENGHNIQSSYYHTEAPTTDDLSFNSITVHTYEPDDSDGIVGDIWIVVDASES